MLESQDGYPVLRFTTGSEVYDDSLFIEKAENLIAYRVAQQSSASDPADHPQAHPDTPAQDPADDPQEVIPATVYLAFQNVDFMQENAELLADYQLRGAFFLTAEEILADPRSIRDLSPRDTCWGSPFGEDAAQISASAFARANDALAEVLGLPEHALAPSPNAQPPRCARVLHLLRADIPGFRRMQSPLPKQRILLVCSENAKRIPLHSVFRQGPPILHTAFRND